MSFSQLPPDILLDIATNLQAQERFIAQYATISRPWNSCIETLTFRNLRIDSEKRLHQATLHLSPERLAALRSIHIYIQLPEYSRSKWFEPESDEDKDLNNSVFSNSLKTFFTVINSWPIEGIILSIQAMSKSDLDNIPDLDLKTERWERTNPGAEHARYESSYLHLTEDLPCISGISKLVLRGVHRVETLYSKDPWTCCPRLLSGETAIRIIQACQGVSSVEAALSDRESKNLELRIRERQSFAESLATLPQSLTNFTLEYPGVIPKNHAFDPPAIPSVNGKDALSNSLNMLSQNLESLDFSGVVSEDLFSITSTTWPRLRNLRVKFDYCTPNGDWLLERDPEVSDMEEDNDEDEDDEDTQYRTLKDWMRYHEIPPRIHFPHREFRKTVNRDLLDDLHIAIAKALAKMPEIRKVELSLGHARAGYVCKYTSDGRDAGKVSWLSRTEMTYIPHDKVLEEWKRAFENRRGVLEVQVLGIEHSWWYRVKNL